MNFVSKTSRFSEYLVKHNKLNEVGFDRWIFYPGMLFGDLPKWWKCGQKRATPHEGLDICFYEDRHGKKHSVDRNTIIPVMYKGDIVQINNDFLGKSIFVKHNIHDKHGNRLYTIYAHTRPINCIQITKTLNEGDRIAEIADTKKERPQIPPHLHISAVWLPETFPPALLNWKTLGEPGKVKLCDPLSFL